MTPLMRRLLVAAVILGSAGQAHAQIRLGDGDAIFSLPVVSLRDIPFRTVVRQQFDYSCGSAAIATLLSFHYGRSVSEAEAFQAMYAAGDQAKIQEVGFSLLDMKRYLATLDLAADGYRIEMEQLTQARTPAILLVEIGGYRHFVVFKGARDGQILIGDPALGLKVYSAADFKRIWSGVAFVIHPRTQPPKTFNAEAEWRPFAAAPLDLAATGRSPSAFTRGLPPLYQITTTFSLDPWLR